MTEFERVRVTQSIRVDAKFGTVNRVTMNDLGETARRPPCLGELDDFKRAGRSVKRGGGHAARAEPTRFVASATRLIELVAALEFRKSVAGMGSGEFARIDESGS